MQKKRISKFLIFIAAIYSIGYLLARFKIVSDHIFLTSSFGFKAADRPEIYGLIFTAEFLIPAIGMFFAFLLIGFLFRKNFLFSSAGILLLITGAYFSIEGILKISVNELWETAAAIGVGIFFIGIGILLIKANSMFSLKKK